MKDLIILLIRLLALVILFAVIVTSIAFLNYGIDGIEVAIKTLESYVGALCLLVISMLVAIGCVKLGFKYFDKK